MQRFELFWRDKKTIKILITGYPTLTWIPKRFPEFPFCHHTQFCCKAYRITRYKSLCRNGRWISMRPTIFSSGDHIITFVLMVLIIEFTDRTIPSYHNVSFAINYLPFIGKQKPKSCPVYVLQISNIFNIRQTYGYQYSYNGYRKQAIVPPSGCFVFIGAFISLE